MSLLPESLRPQLIANALEHRRVRETEGEIAALACAGLYRPVVKLFIPEPRRVWLVSELDPDAPDFLWGLRDLGDGAPELGYFSLTTLITARETFGLTVLQDRHFVADKSIGEYADAAIAAGRIAA